jgi:uncharacterized membrane protein YphA (DoxX/SURF4 family)
MFKRQFRGGQPRVLLSFVSFLRILIGLMFLTTWLRNMSLGLYTGAGLQNFFLHEAPPGENPIGWYAALIDNVILPLRHIFAPLQMVFELAIGLALMFGIFTQIASFAAVFFLLNVFMATFGQEWAWVYLLPVSVLMIVILSRAGRAVGLDSLIYRRRGERGFWLP